MIALTRRSALAHRAPLATPDGTAGLKEVPFEGKLILRGSLAKIGGALTGVLGTALPGKVMETSTGPRAVAQWLSPDEWLLVTAPGAEAALIRDLEAALAGIHAQVVDVSDYYTTIALSGGHAREMLMKIATVDFDARVFKAGMGVTTNLGRTNPWLRATSDNSFAIIIRISMADYLWCLLAEAGHEWGLPDVAPKGSGVTLHLPHFEAESALAASRDPAPPPELS